MILSTKYADRTLFCETIYNISASSNKPLITSLLATLFEIMWDVQFSSMWFSIMLRLIAIFFIWIPLNIYIFVKRLRIGFTLKQFQGLKWIKLSLYHDEFMQWMHLIILSSGMIAIYPFPFKRTDSRKKDSRQSHRYLNSINSSLFSPTFVRTI